MSKWQILFNLFCAVVVIVIAFYYGVRRNYKRWKNAKRKERYSQQGAEMWEQRQEELNLADKYAGFSPAPPPPPPILPPTDE